MLFHVAMQLPGFQTGFSKVLLHDVNGFLFFEDQLSVLTSLASMVVWFNVTAN